MSTELYQLIAEAVTPVGKDSEQLPGRFVQKEDDVYASFKSDSEKPDNEEKVKNFQKKVSKLKEAFEYLDEEELEVIADTIVELMEDEDDVYHVVDSYTNKIHSTHESLKKAKPVMHKLNKEAFNGKPYSGPARYEIIHKSAYNESVEQINELKKSTLASYVKKATDDATNDAWDSAWLRAHRDDDRADSSIRKSNKRRAGIKMALGAYYANQKNESVEELEESEQSFKSHVNRAVKSHFDGDKDLAKKHINDAFYALTSLKDEQEYKLHGTPHYKRFQELRKVYK